VTRRRCAGDTGQVGGAEVLPFGVLIFVVGTLLVTNLWGVVDAKMAADAAAREAVRAYVEAPNGAVADGRARAAATATMAGHGRRTDLMQLAIRRDASRGFERCVDATVEVDYPVPMIRLPWLGAFGTAFEVRAVHSERIDPFRSGLEGIGTC
jgi:hypothetical protein